MNKIRVGMVFLIGLLDMERPICKSIKLISNYILKLLKTVDVINRNNICG
jgi:hypothetical protein